MFANGAVVDAACRAIGGETSEAVSPQTHRPREVAALAAGIAHPRSHAAPHVVIRRALLCRRLAAVPALFLAPDTKPGVPRRSQCLRHHPWCLRRPPEVGGRYPPSAQRPGALWRRLRAPAERVRQRPPSSEACMSADRPHLPPIASPLGAAQRRPRDAEGCARRQPPPEDGRSDGRGAHEMARDRGLSGALRHCRRVQSIAGGSDLEGAIAAVRPADP